MKKTVVLLVLICASLQAVIAQVKEIPERQYKNTVRINVTNPFIINAKSLIFGYERVLKNQQSFSINVGQTALPGFSLRDTDSLQRKSTVSDKGFNISVDYRFYLSAENKYEAPRGVYIGPYYSYNFMERENSWAVKTSTGTGLQNVNTTTSLSVHTLGFELGYQFILWKRISLDMILAGPGIAAYDLKLSIASNLSAEDKQKFFDKINEALAAKFPGYNKVIDEGEFQRKGSAKSTSLGFRYMMMIGYRF